MASCVEKFGSTVEHAIGGFFHKIGLFVGDKPRRTILFCFILTALTGYGFTTWETENRQQKLWVPQDTLAQQETERYQEYFASNARFNSIIVQSSDSGNVLTKERLQQAMAMHKEIETGVATVEDTNYTLTDLCVKPSRSCLSSFEGVCICLVNSILKQWNYDMETLNNDTDVMTTLNNYGSRDSLEAVLGNPTFDTNGTLLSAEAFTVTYFLKSRMEVVDGSEVDPINEGWEESVFLSVAEKVDGSEYEGINSDYISTRSFSDEFGGAITGDLLLVQISYVVAFLYLAANMGTIKCGTGSRWTMAFSALMVVGLSTGAGFGLSSIFGLFFGPVHSILPFILLGIGVDDAFVIVNAFNRERTEPRTKEDNAAITSRTGRALARAGASITVTSLTDLVAFGISASSALPALASFCAYASISIFFLWLFASTFFAATMVLDERRQRDNRRECLCCLTRKVPIEEETDTGFQEDAVSRFFRNYHAPAILSLPGKAITLLTFCGLLGFGIWGALNLSVEDSQRSFIPDDSYLLDYFDATDRLYPDAGIDLNIVFEGSSEIFASRSDLSTLETRLTGLSGASPYIAEPTSDSTYSNVMEGFSEYLKVAGTAGLGNITLGDDGWPSTEADFVSALTQYTARGSPGARYNRDVAFSDDGKSIDAITVHSEYVRLTKESGDRVIDDADRQIDAMDDTRALLEGWSDLPPRFPYSEKFIDIEGFKVIKKELFLNVGLAIAAVAIIVLITVASPMTALLITINVAACIMEILGFMYALGIVIDSVSVINMVLAVGLSVDYSAHVGHCFMVKGGDDKNKRATEALADMGASVLNGAISTFLAVVVLLFSSSYVFRVLSTQFALTVALGVLHGLVALPVMLSLVGPKPFASAKESSEENDTKKETSKIADDGDSGEA